MGSSRFETGKVAEMGRNIVICLGENLLFFLFWPDLNIIRWVIWGFKIYSFHVYFRCHAICYVLWHLCFYVSLHVRCNYWINDIASKALFKALIWFYLCVLRWILNGHSILLSLTWCCAYCTCIAKKIPNIIIKKWVLPICTPTV